MSNSIGSKIWSLFERFVLFVMNLLLKPFHKELKGKQADSFMQFVKFALVGVSNTIVSLAINFGVLFVCSRLGLFAKAQEIKYQAFIANTIAFLLSVIWSYMLNSRFVFKEGEGEKRVWWKTLLKTYAAYAFTGLGLSNLISWLCIDKWGINKYIAVLINLVLSVPINFVLNKFWAYGQKGEANE